MNTNLENSVTSCIAYSTSQPSKSVDNSPNLCITATLSTDKDKNVGADERFVFFLLDHLPSVKNYVNIRLL
jgi:hypothetical protein